MEEYYYGVGRVRSLEARVLTAAQLARMAAAADFAAAFSVLSETSYAEHLNKLKPAFDFEDLCELELISLKNLLYRLAPENEIIVALFKKYDFQNLKILLKAKLAGQKTIETYFKVGTIPWEKLKNYVLNGEKVVDDRGIINAREKADQIYQKSSDPQSIDISLDKDYFSYLKTVCEPSPSSLVKDMVDHQIDLINLKTLLRSQELKKDKKFLAGALLDPGLLDRDFLLGLRDQGVQDMTAKLDFTPYFPMLAEGFEVYSKEKKFYLIEKLMNDFVVSKFRNALYLSSGIEPLVGFYLAKETEIRTLRFILICKKNNVDNTHIKERLLLSYV